MSRFSEQERRSILEQSRELLRPEAEREPLPPPREPTKQELLEAAIARKLDPRDWRREMDELELEHKRARAAIEAPAIEAPWARKIEQLRAELTAGDRRRDPGRARIHA